MNAPLLEMEGTWREIASKMPDFADRQLHVIVLASNETKALDPKKDMRTMDEIFAELTANIPPEELAKIPADFTSQLDHYVYGTPKR